MTASACCACAREEAPNFALGDMGQYICPLGDSGQYICSSCAVALADKILALDQDAVARMWAVSALPDYAGTARKRAPPSTDDAETHADLAIAYLEMGMLPDALASALISTKLGPSKAAFTVLFAKKMLTTSVAAVIGLIQPN